MSVGAAGANGRLQRSLIIVGVNAVALGLALAATAAIVALYDKPVGDALRALYEGSLGSAFAIGTTLNKATPLLFVALAFLVAQKAGLVSIGGEGQLYVGGTTAVAAALAFDGLPRPTGLILALIAGFVGGGLWGALAGWLRARFEVNEVIATLLLNFVGIAVSNLTVQEPALLREPVTDSASLPQSPLLAQVVRLPRLVQDSPNRVHLGIVLAVAAAVAVSVLLRRTVAGFRIRMLGFNPAMAERAGVNVAVLVVLVMFLSGGLAGLAGTSVLLGEQYRLQPEFSPGFGFDGIAVALLARSTPGGAVAAALLFGALRAGGLRLEAAVQVPQALVLVVQGVIILAVAATAYWVERTLRARAGADVVAAAQPELVEANA